ncbi:MAG TPA: hypothetical protein VFA33_06485 [Bryobacteraceae bacterium]|nr:hypothetical protein [Bryobacteraceae bacterium]
MFTQSDRDTLDSLYKQGAKRVRFQDRDYELQSVDDYVKLRHLMDNDIAQAGGQQPVRQVRVYTTNGWGY